MNFSVHLPDSILASLDSYAKEHQTSRSGVIREAVGEYLAHRMAMAWPDDLAQWMAGPEPKQRRTAKEDAPDFDALRAEMNRSMALRESTLTPGGKPASSLRAKRGVRA